MTLTAPFPYAGGKRRSAAEVWQEFGRDIAVYAEPFFGSGAVLLGAPYIPQREIVCDVDGGIVNFWRAMQADPEVVARAADYPSFHHDLTARHAHLVAWLREHGQRLVEDARFFDAEMAGWWAWGKSNWIGEQWCLVEADETYDKRRCSTTQPAPDAACRWGR